MQCCQITRSSPERSAGGTRKGGGESLRDSTQENSSSTNSRSLFLCGVLVERDSVEQQAGVQMLAWEPIIPSNMKLVL